MYHTCIFCSNALGSNDSIEEFPVGSRLAFDAWKGRLWAVCPRCRRWNLAPIEERWEAVERSEKLFSESRLRVHSENIGMAKLRDGTRLIRVGKALPREFAAWRYGDELLRRRKRLALWGGAGTVGAVAVGVGLTAAMSAAIVPSAILGLLNLSQLGMALSSVRSMSRVVHRVPAESSETGEAVVIRAQDMRTARIVEAKRGTGPALLIPGTGFQRVETGSTVRWVPPPPLRIEGDDAERILARSLVGANRRGASGGQVDSALRNLEAAGSRESFFRTVTALEGGLFNQALLHNQNRIPDIGASWRRLAGSFRGERIAGGTVALPPRQIPAPLRLALEMSLHEESERRALEGEMAELEQAWREAEEIAAIADALPDDPLDRLGADGRIAARD
ncbi:hypothetical protein BH23GEM8_BH23GEM8_13980 [soil metagenome]